MSKLDEILEALAWACDDSIDQDDYIEFTGCLVRLGDPKSEAPTVELPWTVRVRRVN